MKSSSFIRISSPSRVIPALLTSTSTGPWCSSTSVNARSTASASVTSHCTPNSPSGAPLPRWVTATESPCSANERAIASPIPRLPPVTSTDLPTCHSPAPAVVVAEPSRWAQVTPGAAAAAGGVSRRSRFRPQIGQAPGPCAASTFSAIGDLLALRRPGRPAAA